MHTTVLLHEATDAVFTDPDGTYADGTYGRGGHSRRLLARLSARGRLVAFDKDPQAVQDATTGPGRIQDARFAIEHASFAQMQERLAARGISRLTGVLFDLGVSSPQIDDASRGFSFRFDAPLDMRMDTTRGETAADFLARADERHIAEVIRDHGEERFAVSIAKALVARRESGRPVRTTRELADTIKQAIPTPARFGDGHPAKRVFQALRIAVNDELGALEAALPAAMRMLRPGGRIAVISFHSLEDRIVKKFIREQARGCTCPPEFPICTCGNEPLLRDLTRKPVRPGARELEANPRAGSAKLRAAAKVGP